MPLPAKKAQATAELLFAAIIWGFGFIATVWALKSVDPISMSFIRFFVTFLVGIMIAVLFLKFSKAQHKTHFKQSFLPGILLSLVIVLQTWGLETTTATNSGFITTLYVVMVPLIELFVFRKRIPKVHALWVLLAIGGTALIIQFHLDQFTKGDLLTLICAVFAAIQIVWIGQIHKQIESAYLFNVYQSFWAALAAIIIIPFYGKLYFNSPDLLAVIGLLSLTFGSTLIAFALQVRAQRVLSPSIASLIFLLESPFALIFAIYFLKESMTELQAMGALLIFFSAVGATLAERRAKS